MSKRFGFTLAEVLITLGIIGVVAAMTIPTLMVDINTKQWSTAANVFEKKLNESLKTKNTQQTISGHATTLSFVEELAKHYKINKICQNDKLQDCFSETVYWGAGEATPEAVDMSTIKTAKHFGLEDWGTELIGVQFANGVSGLVAYNPACSGDPYSNQFNGTSCISVLYDVSGSKNPNTSGKDLGNYGVISRLGGATCAFEIGGTCYSAPILVTEPHIWNVCNYGTSSDPEDLALMSQLGIKTCLYADPEYGRPNTDYWAGAVKACGGVNKMPTLAQLAEIANFIYETTDIGAETEKFSLTRNDTKSTSLGFSTMTDASLNYFSIWSNKEEGLVAYPRQFWAYSTSLGAVPVRWQTGIYTLCLAE